MRREGAWCGRRTNDIFALYNNRSKMHLQEQGVRMDGEGEEAGREGGGERWMISKGMNVTKVIYVYYQRCRYGYELGTVQASGGWGRCTHENSGGVQTEFGNAWEGKEGEGKGGLTRGYRSVRSVLCCRVPFKGR